MIRLMAVIMPSSKKLRNMRDRFTSSSIPLNFTRSTKQKKRRWVNLAQLKPEMPTDEHRDAAHSRIEYV